VRKTTLRRMKRHNPGMSAKLTIGFLGAGKMASALARGFIRAGVVTAGQLSASDPSAAARASFANAVGAKTTGSSAEVAKFAEVLVVAVKPDQVAAVLADIRGSFTAKHCLISIAAGVPLAKLEAGLGAGARLIRVMPNTPALVGASATGLALEGTPHHRLMDLSKVKSELGYRDPEPAAEAIARTARWYVEHPPEPGGEIEQRLQDKFDYATEDKVAAILHDAIRKIAAIQPAKAEPMPHPYAHPKEPNLARDHRNR
jgi:hypothetical protein